MSVSPAEISMFYYFSRNLDNIQVVDTALIRARVVCEVDLVWNVIRPIFNNFLIPSWAIFKGRRRKVNRYNKN